MLYIHGNFVEWTKNLYHGNLFQVEEAFLKLLIVVDVISRRHNFWCFDDGDYGNRALKLRNFKAMVIDRIDSVIESINNQISIQDGWSMVNFQNQVTIINLDKSNFVVWKREILKISCSFDLDDYIVKDPSSKLLSNNSTILDYKHC